MNTQTAAIPSAAPLLFADPSASVYAVLDGASIPDLPTALAKMRPEHACLYRGELPADLAAAAPYLVRLEQSAPFTRWVTEEGWGRHWGVFAVADADLLTLRRHFRTFLTVRRHDGKVLYFRYYDPRVLRVYLPTCDGDECKKVFGPVRRFVMEAEDPRSAVVAVPGRRGPVCSPQTL